MDKSEAKHTPGPWVDPRGPFRTVAAAFHSCQGTFVRLSCGHLGHHTFCPTTSAGDRTHCFACTLAGERLANSQAEIAADMAAAQPWPGSERFDSARAAIAAATPTAPKSPEEPKVHCHVCPEAPDAYCERNCLDVIAAGDDTTPNTTN